MGLKSEINDQIGKLESNISIIHALASELREISSKMDSVETTLAQIHSNLETKADHIKEEQSS